MADSSPDAPTLNGVPDAPVIYVQVRNRPIRTYQLAKSRITIGRSRESDIYLSDLLVSRQHAVLQAIPASPSGSVTYLLRDLQSANGTLINGTAVREHLLAPGDRVSLGESSILYVGVPVAIDISAPTAALVMNPLVPFAPPAPSLPMPQPVPQRVPSVANTMAHPMADTLPPAVPLGQVLESWLVRWVYRVWLVVATVLLVVGLYWVQVHTASTLPHHVAPWQMAMRWLDVFWLTPLPLGLSLWLGWLVFAEAARPDPQPMSVPRVHQPDGTDAPARLVVRFVTRGDNLAVLRASVAAVHMAFSAYRASGLVTGPYGVQVVCETPLDIEGAQVVVVPASYETKQRSRWKARALTYVQHVLPGGDADWHLYLDEESAIDVPLVAGCYHFIAQNEHKARRRFGTAHEVGQGAILYQGGRAFFRGADALRTGDDLGRFRLQYALGVPVFGVHGSYLLVRALDEHALSFDVGYANSVTEDAAWALRAWARGWRFRWVRGYVREQPPQRAMDFIKQRSRWLSGIRIVAHDRQIPLRYRVVLLVFVGLWQVSFVPLLATLAALVLRVPPLGWERAPADFAWACFVLAYLQGLIVQARQTQPKTHWHELTRILLATPLVLGMFAYSLLEVTGVLYSLRSGQGFFVIQKPDLQARPAEPTRHVRSDERLVMALYSTERQEEHDAR